MEWKQQAVSCQRRRPSGRATLLARAAAAGAGLLPQPRRAQAAVAPMLPQLLLLWRRRRRQALTAAAVRRRRALPWLPGLQAARAAAWLAVASWLAAAAVCWLAPLDLLAQTVLVAALPSWPAAVVAAVTAWWVRAALHPPLLPLPLRQAGAAGLRWAP